MPNRDNSADKRIKEKVTGINILSVCFSISLFQNNF